MKRGFRVLAFIVALAWGSLPLAQAAGDLNAKPAANGWQAPLYGFARDSEQWAEFMQELYEKHLYYGALSAALRSLQQYGDVDSKQAAFEILVRLVDIGLPIDVRAAFNSADIEPVGDPAFTDSFFLYKSIINSEKQIKRWADFYLGKVESKDFSKSLFFQSIEAYKAKKFDVARESLNQILKNHEKNPLRVSMIKKVVRTLARIYFEEEQYEKSLDIYKNFLLKLNPTVSLDWLEAAWNLYYLNRPNDALGMLYNLESKTFSDWVYFEKYLLLALIYKDYCRTDYLNGLAGRFQREFGPTLNAIQTGEPLKKITKLKQIYPKTDSPYQEQIEVIRGLENETPSLSRLSGRHEAMARSLYKTELSYRKRVAESLLDRALEANAKQVVLLSESLRFLGFDVAREKYNPDVLFQPEEKKNATSLLVKKSAKNQFTISWRQSGDFWRDERLIYKGSLSNLCQKTE